MKWKISGYVRGQHLKAKSFGEALEEAKAMISYFPTITEIVLTRYEIKEDRKPPQDHDDLDHFETDGTPKYEG